MRSVRAQSGRAWSFHVSNPHRAWVQISRRYAPMTMYRPPLREGWTPEQDEALRNAIDDGVSLERMSVRFKRTGGRSRRAPGPWASLRSVPSDSRMPTALTIPRRGCGHVVGTEHKLLVARITASRNRVTARNDKARCRYVFSYELVTVLVDRNICFSGC